MSGFHGIPVNLEFNIDGFYCIYTHKTNVYCVNFEFM